MSRKSGNRFSEKDMLQQRDLEHFPIPLNREMLLSGSPVRERGLAVLDQLASGELAQADIEHRRQEQAE